jgi:hypothetical protein
VKASTSKAWLQDALSFVLREHVEGRMRAALHQRRVKVLYLKVEEPVFEGEKIVVRWECEYRPHEHADGQNYLGQEEFTLAEVLRLAQR